VRKEQSNIHQAQPPWGKVVDSELKVKDVSGLLSWSQCDTDTISSPLQACVYALAEQAADIIHSSPNGHIE
jgi:hypothetical protein